ncbi:hypothetical protein JAAARDRAFT_40127 [Jaapia argillacea MUCL 33604]|uniref:Uncharacterized protein n=1 Tax=Jaapia argillacea MUCL 33604 TaxID=933084 RepID=A0A067PMI6_9AGAM|nr:hypothetical protein JAAARDRAFT_40127 [Jaapia argillacea MUCL 33604]
MGAIVSAIGNGINAIIMAIADVIMIIVSAIVTVRCSPSHPPPSLPPSPYHYHSRPIRLPSGHSNDNRRYPRHPLLQLFRIT